MAAKLMLFFDYDTQWGADRSRAGYGPRSYGMNEFICTEELLALLADYNIRACFAVVGAASRPGSRPYHDPAQIRAIHAAGHEIASHSMYHDWLPMMSRQRLRQDLKESRDSLEQCIGAPVVSFVPPFNQPFDFWHRGSFCWSERRQVRRERIDLPELCRALAETGYQFTRVSYRSLPLRLASLVFKDVQQGFEKPVFVKGVMTLRVNTDCGFTGRTFEMLARAGRGNGYIVAYGHPHSLAEDSPQSKACLMAFLGMAASLVQRGELEVVLPRQALRRHSERLLAKPSGATI